MYSLDEKRSFNLDSNSKKGTFVYNSERLVAGWTSLYSQSL